MSQTSLITEAKSPSAAGRPWNNPFDKLIKPHLTTVISWRLSFERLS